MGAAIEGLERGRVPRHWLRRVRRREELQVLRGAVWLLLLWLVVGPHLAGGVVCLLCDRVLLSPLDVQIDRKAGRGIDRAGLGPVRYVSAVPRVLQAY